MNPENYLVLAAILFAIGSVGVLTRRNALVAFMSVELMLNAANLALVAGSLITGVLDGQVGTFFVMVVAAAEVVVGLAIIVTIYKTPLDLGRRRQPAEALRGRPCTFSKPSPNRSPRPACSRSRGP